MARRRSLFQSVRSRIMVGGSIWIILMTVLGTYATVLTFSEALRLSDVRTFQEQVYAPAEELVTALQQERLLSVEFIGAGGRTARDRLEGQRRTTDKAVTAFRRSIDTSDVRGEPVLKAMIDAALADLAELSRHRVAITNDDVDRMKAVVAFNRTIETTFRIYQELPSATEPHIGSHYKSVLDLQWTREILTREVSQLAGALAAGRLTTSEHQVFDRTVGAQHLLLESFVNGLDETQRKDWATLVETVPFTTFWNLENEVSDFEDVTGTVPISATAWKRTGNTVAENLRDFEQTLVDDMLALSDDASSALIWRATLIIVVGAVFVFGMITVWLLVAPRYVTKQLTGLKEGALELANHRLPALMAQLRRGEKIDLQIAAPPLEFGQDEFGQVGHAFNQAQQVALRAAVEQAELRSGIRDVFVNLARRSQSLVHRQLALLDEMERRTSDPDELDRLFSIDHLATRMRRHAEDLIILSGSTPGRQWRKPVPMIDVVRSAVGEIEAYSRVSVLPIADGALSGRVVADVVHLLAELVENAATYSPPQTKVRVGGDLVPSGFVIEIEDSGLGMSREDLTRYNEQLGSPPEFNPADSVQLGLFVVARLAQRHGIQVHLRDSPYGGTTAIVLIPGSLIDGADTKPAIEAGQSASNSRAKRPSPARTPTRRAIEERPTIDAPAVATSSAGTSVYDTLALETVSADSLTSGASRDVGPLEARPVSPGRMYTTTDVDLDSTPRGTRSISNRPSPAYSAPEPIPEPAGDPGNTDLGSFEYRHGSLPEAERPFDPDPAPATSKGLPRRVRQASLATELRETTTPPATAQPAEPRAGRSPEEIRQMMATFQHGSLRGRNEALAEDGPPAASARPSPRPSPTSQNEDK